ncbi:MAG TPA: 2,3,4,5-tetrahydropyridine-2,6-dicarboxylate N-succinyltransferase, partial [Rhodocyclaceae bacterium]|nr:2,3,4,5-tetrahydropyridine-2,6-dicarboxylate N-succinyltransferase [Rhodocyclaceae bacterium]
MSQELQQVIEQAWEDRANLKPGSAPAKVGEAVQHILGELDAGTLRVAEKINGEWTTHQWIKKAVLLSFRLEDNVKMESGALNFFDKVPTKFASYDAHKFQQGGFRVVPPAVARRGSYIAKGVVLMPSYVNIGAYVD